MKKLVCLALVLLFSLGCTLALAQGSETENAFAVNPENYPFFYVMGISKAETEVSNAIVVSGCFGDFQLKDNDGEADLDIFGFDEENPVELMLADTCEVLMPADFGDNIVTNLPCEDILQWFATQNVEEDMPFTFYAVVTLDESNQVTKLEYQYFPWG